jgi:hypothetical protein
MQQQQIIPLFLFMIIAVGEINVEKIDLISTSTNTFRISIEPSETLTYTHEQSSHFSNLLLLASKPNNWLYVTGHNYVMRLNALNINNTRDAVYKEREMLSTNKQAHMNAKKKTPPNFIRLLLHRQPQSDLIVCGTNLGKSHIYDLKESDLSNRIEYNGRFLCPGSAAHANLGLITKSTGTNPMFAALWLDEDERLVYCHKYNDEENRI